MNENSRLRSEGRSPAAWLGDEAPAPADEPEALLRALDELWAGGPSGDALQAMRQSLDAWWAQQHTLVYYDSLPSPIGRVYVAVSDRGLISVDFGFPDDEAYLQHLRAYHFAGKELAVYHAPARLVEVARQLEEYFRGERTGFDYPLDLTHVSDFQREVLNATRQVPRGQVVSYKEIARRIGRPQASRAVGNALGRNPVPIVIPCHRVLPQDGTLGGYSGGGGSDTKARLLALEGVQPGKEGLYAPA